MIEREYPLVQIGKSDWTFWSNDGHRLYRVRQIRDRGPGDRNSVLGWWELFRWTPGSVPGLIYRTDDWNNWDTCGFVTRTRAEAIQDALLMGSRG